MSNNTRGMFKITCCILALVAFVQLLQCTAMDPELYINRSTQRQIVIYLHNIPYIAFEEKSFDVAIFENFDAKNAPNNWNLLIVTSEFTLHQRFESGFCSCTLSSTLIESTVSFEVRAVLRFGTNASTLSATIPVAYGRLPTMQAEMHYDPISIDDYYTLEIWNHASAEVVSGRAKELTDLLHSFVNNAHQSTVIMNNVRQGYSGKKFQLFLNAVGSIPKSRYLEVGIYNGSSLTPILQGNNDLSVVAIDIWEDESITWNDGKSNALSLKDSVLSHIQTNYNQTGKVHIIHDSCWNVRTNTITSLLNGKANIYFYDAGHTVPNHYLSFGQFFGAMDDVFIFIVDDWDWNSVRKPTMRALENYNVHIVTQIEITTLISGKMHSANEIGSWHNGMVAFVLSKY